MEDKGSKPLFSKRNSLEIINRSYFVYPSCAIAFALKIELKVLKKLYRRVGIYVSKDQELRLFKSFLGTLPNLNNILPDAFNRRIMLYWHTLSHQKGVSYKIKFEENLRSFICKYYLDLPAPVIAEIFDIDIDYVLLILIQEGIKISNSNRKKIWYAFSRSKICPEIKDLTTIQRSNYWSAWEKRHDQWLKKLKSHRRYKVSLEKRLNKMAKFRDLLVLNEGLITIACSGDCGESWPRTNLFFPKYLRSEDGLGRKCKYCIAKISAKKSKRVRKEKGRTFLNKETRDRLVDLYIAYGKIIPTDLWQSFLPYSSAVLTRMRLEAKVKISNLEKVEIPWRWYFMETMPDMPLLSLDERQALKFASENYKNRIQMEYGRDQWFELDQLKLSQLRIKEAKDSNAPYIQERCRHCNKPYLYTEEFFKIRKGKLEKFCKVCVSEENKKQRLKQLRKRFGN